MSDAIPSNTVHRTSRRRQQEPASPGRSSQQQPARPQSWAGKTPQEILARWLEQGVESYSGYCSGQEAVIEEYGKTVLELAKRIGVRHNPKMFKGK